MGKIHELWEKIYFSSTCGYSDELSDRRLKIEMNKNRDNDNKMIKEIRNEQYERMRV